MEQEKQEPFGDSEVNKVKRERNKLQKENEDLKTKINIMKAQSIERAWTRKAVYLLVFFVPLLLLAILQYVL